MPSTDRTPLEPVEPFDTAHPRVPPSLVVGSCVSGPVTAGQVETFFTDVWHQTYRTVEQVAPAARSVRDPYDVAMFNGWHIRHLTSWALDLVAAGFDLPGGHGPAWQPGAGPATPLWNVAAVPLRLADHLASTTTLISGHLAKVWDRDVRAVVNALPEVSLADAPGGHRAAYAFLALDCLARHHPDRYARMSPAEQAELGTTYANRFTSLETQHTQPQHSQPLHDRSALRQSGVVVGSPVTRSIGQVQDAVLADELMTWPEDAGLPPTAADLWAAGRRLRTTGQDLPTGPHVFDVPVYEAVRTQVSDLVAAHRDGTPPGAHGVARFAQVIEALHNQPAPAAHPEQHSTREAMDRLTRAIERVQHYAGRQAPARPTGTAQATPGASRDHPETEQQDSPSIARTGPGGPSL